MGKMAPVDLLNASLQKASICKKRYNMLEAHKGKCNKTSYAYNYLTILLLPKGKNVANIFSNQSVIRSDQISRSVVFDSL